MKVEHKTPQNDPTLGSFDCHAICYRTEVTNTNSVPIQVVWFQFFIEHDGQWSGFNIRNRVLREQDFLDWYNDGDDFEDGWIPPGATAACDPNWHGGNDDHFPRVKWAFLAVDKEGNTYDDEAEVSKEATVIAYGKSKED